MDEIPTAVNLKSAARKKHMSGNYDDDSYGEIDTPPKVKPDDSYGFSDGAGGDGNNPQAGGDPDSPQGVERALDMPLAGQPNRREDPPYHDNMNVLDYASEPNHRSQAEPEFEEESEIMRSRVGDEDFISPYQSVFGPVEPVDVDPNRSRRFRVDDSALRAEALEDQELSQILNPDIPRILNDPSRLNSHPGTKRSNLFLKRNFMAVETMLGKMARRAKRQGFDGLRDAQGRVNAVLAIRQKIDRKKRRKEGIKRLGTLAKIYQKQQAARCIERWSEALDRFHQRQQDKLRLAQVFVVMMGYKSKELARIALGRLIGLETILQKEAEQRKRRQGEQELIRNMKEKGFRVCSELLRRLVLLRTKDALNRMHREAVCPYGGSRRKGPYARNAATMIIANIIGKKFDESAREGMEAIKEKNDSILRNPALAKRIAGLHNMKKLMIKLGRRKHGKRLFARMKILFNKKQRKGYSLLFESLNRIEKKRKNDVFRKIFAQNIGLLQYQKLCTYFSGLFAKLVAAKRRRELVDSFNEVRRVAQREVARRRAARNLLIKLARIAASLKADVFNKVKIVPAVQEMFIFERDKYERSVRLRGALKIGNCFANYYRKFLFERVRKGFSWLRKFNHQFKIPAYYQRLDNFRVVFDERRKDRLHQAFHRLKGRSTFYLLQRYFRENIDLSEGLNEELLFALDKNIPSPHPKLQQVLEFWNTTYDAEDAPVVCC